MTYGVHPLSREPYGCRSSHVVTAFAASLMATAATLIAKSARGLKRHRVLGATYCLNALAELGNPALSI